MPYASVASVQSRYEQEIDDGLASLVSVRLADAELVIRQSIPDLDDKVSAGDINEDIVVMVEAEAVLRLIRNPNGFSAETDGNYSYAIYKQVASGRLEITDDEWSLLGLSSSVFVITPFLEWLIECDPIAAFLRGD